MLDELIKARGERDKCLLEKSRREINNPQVKAKEEKIKELGGLIVKLSEMFSETELLEGVYIPGPIYEMFNKEPRPMSYYEDYFKNLAKGIKNKLDKKNTEIERIKAKLDEKDGIIKKKEAELDKCRQLYSALKTNLPYHPLLKTYQIQ